MQNPKLYVRIIRGCYDCPHAQLVDGFGKCGFLDKWLSDGDYSYRGLGSYSNPPQWCPLEDAPQNNSEAKTEQTHNRQSPKSEPSVECGSCGTKRQVNQRYHVVLECPHCHEPQYVL